MATKRMKRNVYESEVEDGVCCHRVTFWYDLEDRTLTDELKERLHEEAENRAKHCINDGCHSGDLNYVDPVGNDGFELWGWWEIKAD